ncbi:MAG: OadG family protein [Clostridiales bacterium]|nr:OadG family protein [Clostridiales bacterium]
MYPVFFGMIQAVKAESGYGEYLKNIDWTQVATLVIAGVVIVMVVFIVLIFVFKYFGLAVSKSQNLSHKKDEKPVKPLPVLNSSASRAAAAPPVQQGISGEIVAAIAAAISASEGGKQVVIRSIKVKKVAGRNPWAAAAAADNTRPF